MRRYVLSGFIVVTLASGCSAEVVDGRAVPAANGSGSSGATVQSGARFTDAAAAADVLDDVRNGVQAVNTYDYRDLAAAQSNALRYTTGKLSTDLQTTYRTVISRNAVPLRASQQAQVNDIGINSLGGTTASLLVFGQLTVRTAKTPGPRKDPFAVTVRAQRVGARWLLSQVTVDGTLTGAPARTAPLRAAATSARSTATAISTLRRTTFDADYARLLAMTTGTLRTDLQNRRAATLKSLQGGGFDLAADVRSLAVAEASGTRCVVLVRLTGYRVVAGKRDRPTSQSLRVTVVAVGSRWLVEDIASVGVS